MTRLAATALVLALASALPARAHHAFAAFDQETELTLAGTVAEYHWGDPHTWIVLDAAGADGRPQRWSIETLSAGSMARRGWSPQSFHAGDRVTLKLHPMKDGSAGGQFIGAILPDGSRLGRMEAE